MKPWATTTTGSRSSAKSTQKSKRLSSWAPRVLRRSIFTESFCCNKGAWTRHCERSQEKPGKGDSAQSAVRARLRRIVPGLCAVPGIAEGSGQRSYYNKAVQLDPGQHVYAVNLTYLLINSGRYAEARTMAQRILAAARSDGEKEVANNLLTNTQQAETWAAKKQLLEAASRTVGDSPGPISGVVPRPDGSSQPQETSTSQIPLRYGGLAADGPISSAECSSNSEVFLNVNLGKGPVTFHAADIGRISLTWADGTAGSHPWTLARSGKDAA